jgi:hypothetical protein
MPDLNVIAIVKDSERYVFVFDDTEQSAQQLLQTLGIFAADKELSFTWYDAAVASQKVRKISQETNVADASRIPRS